MDGVVIAACITAIFAIIGTVIKPIVENRQKTRELRMKTRLEWISEVRTISSDLVTNLIFFYNEVYALSNYFVTDTGRTLEKKMEEANDKINEINVSKKEIQKNASLLRLYFNANDSEGKNKPVIDKIKSVVFTTLSMMNSENLGTHDFSKVMNDPKKYADLCENSIADFSDIISNYLKSEWDRAKEGK